MDKIAQLDFPALEQATVPRFAGRQVAAIFEGPFGLISLILTFSGVALLIYLLFGGFKLMTSSGNPKSVQSAKETITNALIGFIIIFAAFWIVQIVAIFLGLESITNIFG